MRAGILISAVSHIALVVLALLGTPTLFEEGGTRSIEAEIVREQDAPPAPVPEQKPEKPPEKEVAMPPARLDTKEASPPKAEPPAQAKSPPPQVPANQAAPTAQAALPTPAQPEPAPQPQGQSPQPPLSIFDPANIPTLLDLPNAPLYGFDSAATAVANLSNDEKGAFKAHLRKCWKLPGSMSPTQTTRVVMRVYLRPDGALASDPVLVEASASRDGPALVKTAINALKGCQPYGFLPADKYREWKVLDLSFSPREMAGG